MRGLGTPLAALHGSDLTTLPRDLWCRNLEPENVCKYLDNLMAHLGRLITSPNVNVREMAVSAIGSVVIGSRHHFAKYASPVASLLWPPCGCCRPHACLTGACRGVLQVL